ncbi:MAG TPA: type VI secretion system baseplate subunit TssE [Bryobacteraceae bacterium]|nr:type VI secretion system baseplate subunit TssE [Bryobacteraceae bacterium]
MMAGKNAPRPALPSLIDRLIDLEPRNRAEAPTAHLQTMEALKDSVRRHLEWLFNSRRPPLEPPDSAKELWGSVYCYGLPDITGLALSSTEDHQKLARMLETAIASFEPRLLNPVVTVLPGLSANRILRFQVAALLRLEPAPARVVFDTTLELTSGAYGVGGGRHA